MVKDNKLKKILYSIAVLVIIFFALLILSSSANVEVKYSYQDEVTITNEYSYDNKIGELNLKNNGILPARIQLKSIRGCLFESEFGDNELFITYRGAMISYFNGYREYKYDISSGEEKKVDIIVEYLPRKVIDNKDEIINQTTTLYLFEVEKGLDNYYNFCSNAVKEDAFKTITINSN